MATRFVPVGFTAFLRSAVSWPSTPGTRGDETAPRREAEGAAAATAPAVPALESPTPTVTSRVAWRTKGDVRDSLRASGWKHAKPPRRRARLRAGRDHRTRTDRASPASRDHWRAWLAQCHHHRHRQTTPRARFEIRRRDQGRRPAIQILVGSADRPSQAGADAQKA